jgi:proteasome lid subunit RPN8/RPN11
MVEHCKEEKPLEACGILSGAGNRVSRGYPMSNVQRSPVRYLMDPEEQYRVMGEIWAAKEELVAIYHSHPTARAYPSNTDISLAYYPEAFYVIVSLRNTRPEVRAFRIVDGQVSEASITVLDDATGDWRDLRVHP